MSDDYTVYAVGDVHRDFGDFNQFLNKLHPSSIILQCGDFGYWPREPLSKIYSRNNPKYPKDRPRPKPKEGTLIFWADGNHEDHQELSLRTTDELWPRVYYMPRGSLLQLPDGRTVMFMGGAMSIDKEMRKYGIDWFPEEVISDHDIRTLNYEGPVDIMISHTCPQEFDVDVGSKEKGYYSDRSRAALSYILYHYKPSLWYFGHWHHYKTGYDNGCRWTALDYVGHGRFCEEVKT